jgi:hypothetical protein
MWSDSTYPNDFSITTVVKYDNEATIEKEILFNPKETSYTRIIQMSYSEL